MEKYFDYLVELRDSGVVNPVAAAVYLEAQFGLNRYEARDILLAWIDSFSATANKAPSNV